MNVILAMLMAICLFNCGPMGNPGSPSHVQCYSGGQLVYEADTDTFSSGGNGTSWRIGSTEYRASTGMECIARER